MLFLTRTMLPAFALAAMMSVAQAQTATDQDHTAHHPGGAATTAQAQPAPAPTPSQPMQDARPGTPGNAPMMGQGMGSGAIVQPGNQQPGGQPGMMMNMDQMRQMMGGMMGQQDGQSGMMGNMGAMMPMMRQMMMGQQGGMGDAVRAHRGPHRLPEDRTQDHRRPDAAVERFRRHAAGERQGPPDHARADGQGRHAVLVAGAPGVPAEGLSTRLDGLKALETAAKPLYAVLTDDQKKLADQLLSGPMGMM